MNHSTITSIAAHLLLLPLLLLLLLLDKNYDFHTYIYYYHYILTPSAYSPLLSNYPHPIYIMYRSPSSSIYYAGSTNSTMSPLPPLLPLPLLLPLLLLRCTAASSVRATAPPTSTLPSVEVGVSSMK